MWTYEGLADLICEAQQAAHSCGANWSFELSRKAELTEIEQLERDVGIRLPPSYRDFLLLHNGAKFSIDVTGSIDWSYPMSILSINEVMEATIDTRDTLVQIAKLDSNQVNSIIAIAAYGDGADRCLLNGTLRNGEGEIAVTDAFHEVPQEWSSSVIAGSFDEWLRKMFEAVIGRQLLLEYWIPTPIVEA